MRGSDSPLEFYVDLSLGRSVVRMEGVPDPEWLERAGREGWIVLSKDKRLRHDREQRQMMIEHGVRAFVLTSGNLKAPEQAQRFLANIRRIERAAARETVCIYAVHARRIERLWPR